MKNFRQDFRNFAKFEANFVSLSTIFAIFGMLGGIDLADFVVLDSF